MKQKRKVFCRIDSVDTQLMMKVTCSSMWTIEIHVQLMLKVTCKQQKYINWQFSVREECIPASLTVIQQMQPMDNRDEFPKKVEWDGDDCKLRNIKRVGIKKVIE